MNCDLDIETPEYFVGIYTIWHNDKIILVDSFIYEDCYTEYQADALLWEDLKEECKKNRFSELGEFIYNTKDLDIDIVESHFFEDEQYKNIVEMLETNLEIYKATQQEKLSIKGRQDNYNMTDLLEALDFCLEMDELFGEEDE